MKTYIVAHYDRFYDKNVLLKILARSKDGATLKAVEAIGFEVINDSVEDTLRSMPDTILSEPMEVL